jgi:hypothetical protein
VRVEQLPHELARPRLVDAEDDDRAGVIGQGGGAGA